MRIVNLKAENIKRIVAIEIAPTGDVVKITGRNAQGKSSVLDAIMYALGGKSAIPAKPVRDGEEKGSVTLDLGDMLVERRFTAGGANSTVTVTNKDGAKFGSPQAILDGLIGRLAFDPLEFMRMGGKEQFETLRDLVGLDFTELDEQRKQYYDERTEHGREYKRLKAQREAVKFDPKGAREEVSSSEILAEYNAAKIKNERIDQAKQALQAAKTEIDQLETRLAELYAKLPELEKPTQEEPADLEAIEKRLNTLDESNKNARAVKQAADLDQQIKDVEEKGAVCKAKIEEIDKDKADMIAACNMPVHGLQFGEGEVLYNGLPLSQASSAEQLRVSLAMAMAMNPKLRIIRITDGSLLDSASMKTIEEMAQDNDYQVWMEVVDESGKIGVVIEDGAVVAVNG